MLQAVTSYDKFHEIDGMVTGVSHSKNYNYVINDEGAIHDARLDCDRWAVAVDNRWVAKGEYSPALLSVLVKFRFSPETYETGLTHLSMIAPAATMFRPEEEIELRVKMVPKATRNITLKITARSKGMPNPILL
jgi:hypothetical protein